MDEPSLAYLAGFFDGEGSLGIDGRGTDGAHRASLLVQITQNDSPAASDLLDAIVARFGGRISRVDTGLRVSLRYAVTGDGAIVFLRALRPHLVLKAEQVDVALRWREEKEPTARDALGRIVAKSAAQREADDQAAATLRSLKRAGLTVGAPASVAGMLVRTTWV